MRPNPSSPKLAAKPTKKPAEVVVKDIRRATRRHFSAEDKIRIVLEGLRGEESIAELCRRDFALIPVKDGQGDGKLQLECIVAP